MRLIPMSVALLASAVTFSAQADNRLAVSDAFPALSLNDQHDEPVAVPGDADVLFFAESKDADDWFDKTISEFDPALLLEGKWLYLSDISRMPSLVTRMFALPSLRGRDYPVALIREGEKAESLPAQDECITVFLMQSQTISAIDYWCDPEQAAAGLQALLD